MCIIIKTSPVSPELRYAFCKGAQRPHKQKDPRFWLVGGILVFMWPLGPLLQGAVTFDAQFLCFVGRRLALKL